MTDLKIVAKANNCLTKSNLKQLNPNLFTRKSGSKLTPHKKFTQTDWMKLIHQEWVFLRKFKLKHLWTLKKLILDSEKFLEVRSSKHIKTRSNLNSTLVFQLYKHHYLTKAVQEDQSRWRLNLKKKFKLDKTNQY